MLHAIVFHFYLNGSREINVLKFSSFGLRSQVKSFSQLRNDFYETDTFYLSNGEETSVRGTKVTREESQKSPPLDKKSGKILRRHNSEPLLQGKEDNITRVVKCHISSETSTPHFTCVQLKKK